ncbi:phosphopantetheine-binding protein [Micromonospora sp. NPDC005174]|uniref:acyl carrier protein n=1 Tax=unclassified Micromonospora TaxID=2617518 RepID=UPI0033A4D862
MPADVFAFLVDALKNMNYDISSVTRETALGAKGLGLESLAVAEVSIQVEDAYGVQFDEDEAERLAMMTVGDLADEITTRMEQK